jgi:GT2 family glycosyltransferase
MLREQRRLAGARQEIVSLVTLIHDGRWPNRQVAKSVLAQSYPHLEWVLVAPEGEETFAPDWLKRDPRARITTVPRDTSRADAWNAGWSEARGRFAALLNCDDVLSFSALSEMTTAAEQLAVDVLYSDEDRLSPSGQRHSPRFKPDWSPELLMASNYIGRLTMIRRELVLDVGGFRAAYADAEEWDLLLRLSLRKARFGRVPQCLYHRGESDASVSSENEHAAVQDYCVQLGLDATVSTAQGFVRVSWPVRDTPTVSIVIPSRDAVEVLERCVHGLTEGTSYPHHELIIVDNGSTDSRTLELYRELKRRGRCVVVPFDREFNYSAACNAGAAVATGELLLFLNNDIEILNPDWLEEMVRWAQLPEIGVVGAKLLYPDRTIQHAGVVFGVGLVGHIFGRQREDAQGLFGSSTCYRNYVAVTGACQMMRKDVFNSVGGYDERFRLSFSDIVLCLEAKRRGLRIVYTPHARLIHHESYTRKRDDSAEDLLRLVQYLEASHFVVDPYFHPELDPKSLAPALRPPFDPSPQQVIREYMDRVKSSVVAAR